MPGIRTDEGFTLIELMIVVVIIGILAAVAIPQFLKYQLKAKTTEATRNLGAIKTTEEAFSMKWGAYVLTVEVPVARTPDSTKVTWAVPDGSKGFALLGFAPIGQIYYNYAVNGYDVTAANLAAANCTAAGNIAAAADETSVGIDPGGMPAAINSVASTRDTNDIMWFARGDLDDDGNDGCFVMGDDSGEIVPIPGSTGDAIF